MSFKRFGLKYKYAQTTTTKDCSTHNFNQTFANITWANGTHREGRDGEKDRNHINITIKVRDYRLRITDKADPRLYSMRYNNDEYKASLYVDTCTPR